MRAQTDDGLFQQFQFNFSPPGARSGAMGQAFIGWSDDPSAAITNPAGLLTQVDRFQVHFEFKHTDLMIDRLAEPDALFTNRPTTFGESLDFLSFFSIAAKLKDGLIIAFSRHEFLNLQEKFRLQPRAIPGLEDERNPGRFFAFFPSEGRFDLTGVRYAGTIAALVLDKRQKKKQQPAAGRMQHQQGNRQHQAERWLSLGFTFSIDRIDSATSETRFDFHPSTINPNNIAEVTVNQRAVISRVAIEDKDLDYSFTAGVSYHHDTGLSLGAVYSRGSRFNLKESFLVDPNLADGVVELIPGDTNLDTVPDFPVETSINVPDRIGVGVGVSPTDLKAGGAIGNLGVRFVLDLVWVEYSDLLEDFTPLFSAFPVNSPRPLVQSDFEIDDALEIHFGNETQFVMGASGPDLFLRSGLFTNPDHRQRFVGRTGDSEIDTVFQNIFKFEDNDTEIGWSVGGGLAWTWAERRLQVDVAYASIGSFNEFVASLVFGFGGSVE